MIKLFEKFSNVEDVKESIFLKAVETYDINLINFFIKKGYDINSNGALYAATYDENVLKYFLKNNADVKILNNNWKLQTQLENDIVQKVLIDFGYDSFIYKTVGFNNKIKKYGQKYIDIIEQYKNYEKFNL